MSPFSRPLMLIFATAITLAVFASSTRVEAFGGPPGGPFSNGSYFPNEGTFSAVVRGTNVAGTLQFSTTAGAGPSSPTSSSVDSNSGQALGTTATQTQSTNGGGGLGSTGVATIYYDGDTYRGNSQGTLNPADSTMTVTFQASAEGQGEGEVIIDRPVITLVNLPIQGPDGNIVDYVTSNQTTFQPVDKTRYFDSLYFNGYAECKTSNAFPNQEFKGKGQAEFQQLLTAGEINTAYFPYVDAVSMQISVTGVRLSNTASAFNTANVRRPSVNSFSVLVQDPK